jgi:hypothetical protein
VALAIKNHYRPAEIAEHFRYCRSFIYQLIRLGEVEAVKIHGTLRIPRSEACRVFCQGTGDCPGCEYGIRE